MEAARLLKAAARVPYHASRPNAWASRFRENIKGARRALSAHIRGAERANSPINEVHRDAPRLRPEVMRQAEEHGVLLAQLEGLERETDELESPDVWRMVDLGECALILEKALERHHDRFLDLVHEAHVRELGGEAG
jgi:hypothetical protein